jgi:hypothetical protein
MGILSSGPSFNFYYGDERRIVDSAERVVRVSIKSMNIMRGLQKLPFRGE